MLRRMCVLLFAVAVMLGLAGPIKSQSQPEPKNPVDQLAWMIGGKWTAAGDKGPDGKPFHVESRFSWAENHRSLKFTTWFLMDGKLVPVYEGMYAWHPAKKKFTFLYTDNEGSLTEGDAALAGKQMEQEFHIVEPNGVTQSFRSTVTHSDPDIYDWNVRRQNKTGEWVVMFALQYKRKPI